MTGEKSDGYDEPSPCRPYQPPAQAPSVDELIERCLAGDQHAWEQIVRLHWRKVFNVAYKFVGKHDEAEDLTQDIFLKIFKSLNTFDRRANFQTWLISVSRNLCIDHYRSVRKERETIDRDVDPGDLMPVSVEVSPYAGPRGARSRVDAARGDDVAARHAADGRAAARHPGTDVSGDRRPAGIAGRHREITDQSRAD